MTQAAHSFLLSLKDKIGEKDLVSIQNKLENISDDKIMSLSVIPLKYPLLGLIFGLFFGGLGVDRYYKGDIGLGILKFLSMFILIGFFWVVFDLFLVYKGIQKDNFNKLNTALLGY